MNERRKVLYGEDSWLMANDQVELALTVRGGHMAPVTFFRASAKPVQPYYISPWQGKNVRTGVPVLDVLRGDFFCMPFGGGNSYRGENHPVHGESAGSTWRFDGLERNAEVTELRLRLHTRVRPGRITKRLSLVQGQNVIYCQHALDGFSGRMCLSHHATLAVPEMPGSLRLSLSPMRLGRVVPRSALANTGNEYYFLAPGKQFTDLSRVPTIWKDPPFEDCSTHPLRYGFMDLVSIFARPAGTPAWTAVVMPGRDCLWFALKNSQLLPQTTLWMSNGGRHASPWNGINRCLGVEDGCAYFTFGLADSLRKNELTEAGIPTALGLRPDRQTCINYIQGLARIPRGFDRVKSLTFGKDSVRFTSWSGKNAQAAIRWSYLYTGELARPAALR